MWNELIKVIKYENIDQNDKVKAEMLLNSLNTAAGATLMRKEIQCFLEEMENKYDFPKKVSLENELNNLISEMQEFQSYWENKPKSRNETIMVSNRMNKYITDINKIKNKINYEKNKNSTKTKKEI